MDSDGLRKILKQVLTRTPGVMFDIMEPEATPPPASPGNQDWCVSLNRRQMPSMEERLCCRFAPEHCVTTWPDFAMLVLEETVVEVAIGLSNDLLGRRDVTNKEFRHTAYCQFILWRHGKLGSEKPAGNPLLHSFYNSGYVRTVYRL